MDPITPQNPPPTPAATPADASAPGSPTATPQPGGWPSGVAAGSGYQPRTYPSVVSNLFDTGLHRVIFETIAGKKTMEVTEADFIDSVALEAMVSRTKAEGSLGTLVDERGQAIDLLRDVCRHGSNPFKLVNFATYEATFFDLAILDHGTLDGVRPAWDQLIVPNLTRLGISLDPGVVPRNAPVGLGVQAPSAGGPEDPAMKTIAMLQAVLVRLSAYQTTGTSAAEPLPARRLDETPIWREEVAPLLASPFISA